MASHRLGAAPVQWYCGWLECRILAPRAEETRMKQLITFSALLLSALLVGTMFGIWFGYDPQGVSGPAYVEVQQRAITALNVPMPILGAICIVLCLACAYLGRHERGKLYLFLAAALLLATAGLITRFLNQPINAVVMTWNPQSPPSEWIVLRDRWWQWHMLRTAVAIVGFALMLIAGQAGERRG
jgi:uncharacterized membrane protein